jgi:hypothetical protein
VRWAALATCAVVAFTGCGGGDEEATACAEIEGERGRVACVVNSLMKAYGAGDGKTACGLMTEPGRRLYLTLYRRDFDKDATTCSEAVAQVAERFGSEGGDAPEQVVTPDEVEIQGVRAEASSDFRGAMSLRRVDGEWKVAVPGFFD